LLDSDLAGAHSLAPALAQALSTHAIFFFVNDSDSWSYRLADAQGNISEYDSDENADENDDDEDLVAAGPAIAQINALMRDGSILQKMQEMQARMSAAAPPEVRAAEDRIKSGQGTAADMQQYQAWAMSEMPKHIEEMRSFLGGAFTPPTAAKKPTARKTKRKPTAAERAALKNRLAALRPILAPGVNEEDVESIFSRRAVFAEDVLAEFLPLLGISDYYSNLSYQYLRESSAADLSSHNIHFLHHLHFQPSS
jgi:hypothetical protein